MSAILLGCLLAGCSNTSTPEAKKNPQAKQPTETNEIETALAKLDPQDRKLAEEQKFCAAHNKARLGSMGTPVKLLVQDKPVFLCCDGCKKEALKDEEATLKKVEDLKAKNK
jgi:outer membrane murein-binding lipoprotein Lpp